MKVNFTVLNRSEILDRMRARAGQIAAALHKELRDQMFLTEKWVRDNKLQAGSITTPPIGTEDESLVHRSGTLSRSITSDATLSGSKILGTVGVSTSAVPYARIHELGGVIEPVSAPVLRFKIEGQWRSAKQVVIPARPYIGPSILARRDEIIEALRGRLMSELDAA